MKRRDRRVLSRKKNDILKMTKKPPRFIVIISITIGLIAGFVFWYFLSRCGESGCTLSYYILFIEMVCSTAFFLALPYIMYADNE